MTTSTTPTREQFYLALADFHRADSIEKTAKKLRETARETILDFWRLHMDEAIPTGDDGKTMFLAAEDASIPGVTITVPVKKGLPSRFDDDRTEEAFRELEDLDPVSADALFETYKRFIGPEAVIKLAKNRPLVARVIAGVLMKYALPATGDEAMAPRVAAAKAKKLV